MGTDRKGPLAAFVVIAIVAAILLVTSVRSQAQPQWFDHDELPATVVAAPPIGDPLRWAPTVSAGQVVEHGLVLAPKPTPGPTDDEGSSAVLVSGDATYDGSVTATTAGAVTTPTATVTRHHHAAHHTGHHTRHHTRHHARHHTASTTSGTATQVDPAAVSVQTPQHGRHLGSSHVSGARAGHGHGRHLGWRHRS